MLLCAVVRDRWIDERGRRHWDNCPRAAVVERFSSHATHGSAGPLPRISLCILHTEKIR